MNPARSSALTADPPVTEAAGSPAAEPTLDDLTYTATGLPSGVSMTTDGMMSGAVNSLGTHTVTITTTAPSRVLRRVTFDWIVL